MLAAALNSYKHHTMVCQSNWNSLCVRLLISLGGIAGRCGTVAYFADCTTNQAVEDYPCCVRPAHQTCFPVMRRVDQCPVILIWSTSILQVRPERSANLSVGGCLQVMLAQQESIAQVMSLYEAVCMESQGSSQASQPQLQAVKQESSVGKACLKQDRSACHETWHV